MHLLQGGVELGVIALWARPRERRDNALDIINAQSDADYAVPSIIST
jgi:hypothetical protein